jgi:tetratricopeptide (TPR) repeat protein
MEEGKIYSKNAQSITARLLVVFAFVFALIFVWSCIRLQIGNMFAELTSPDESGAAETAQLARKLAPSDPLANWLATTTEKYSYGKEQTETVAAGYTDVVRLSPNDFRWWNELARAREQAEDFAGAEEAFRRMLALAPAYTYPHWQFANFLLRRGKSDEAFAELKKTAAGDTIYRDQTYSLVWDYFDNDVAKVEDVAGDFASAKISLTKFFALHQQPEESLRIWKSLSEEEKKENLPLARIVAQGLFERKYFRPAVEFVHDLEIEPDANFEVIENGGFENPIGGKEYIFFGWHVLSIEKTDVKLDSKQKHSGNKSLRLLFNGYAKPDFGNVYSITAVEPNSRYKLSFWLKTENLKSAGAPTVEVINANDDKLIAATKPFPDGSNDWQEITLDFATPGNAQGVLIRTSRGFCGDNCPIVGTIWYDDFLLGKQK